MAMSDTGSLTPVTTPTESFGQAEIKSDIVKQTYEIATGAYCVVGSVPSGLPELAEGEYDRYVFRMGDNPRLERVTITIDTKQLEEQASIRKINRAIQRAQH